MTKRLGSRGRPGASSSINNRVPTVVAPAARTAALKASRRDSHQRKMAQVPGTDCGGRKKKLVRAPIPIYFIRQSALAQAGGPEGLFKQFSVQGPGPIWWCAFRICEIRGSTVQAAGW